MFDDVIDKFSEKFNFNKSNLQKESLDSNKSNNTSKVFSSYQDEKSTSYEPEESNDLTLVNLLSIKDKGGNTPMLFAAFRGNIKIMENSERRMPSGLTPRRSSWKARLWS